jgi:hypothetical protein
MNQRNQFINDFRGSALGTINLDSTDIERFQNQTLRPILKLQNELLLAVFSNYINQSKTLFNDFSTDKKASFIENSIQKDTKLRNTFQGILIGLFTNVEYAIYIENPSDLNKRMMNMLIERLKSQLQVFDIPR